MARRWDLFCRVVDNYGDIGIAWRLARQLTATGEAVRLFVDDLATFARLEPRVDLGAHAQRVADVAIARWPDAAYDPADVVVEMLGCGLGAALQADLASRTPPPVWIDFEHLSAESWVERFHGLPSPHPSRPLVKHFFYPGFGAATGGLLVEPDLDARRRVFLDDAAEVRAARRRFGIADGRRVASLFAYPGAPFAALFAALADAGGWTVVVPEGVAAAAIAGRRPAIGSAPEIVVVPFVAQDDYDRLLWLGDVNFVRGEDSFVRAQAAGRPFVWHAYPQAGAAQLVKLAAFEERYAASLSVELAGVQRAWWHAWNAPDAGAPQAARAWLAALPRLAEAAAAWRVGLAAESPLVARLREFAAARASS